MAFAAVLGAAQAWIIVDLDGRFTALRFIRFQPQDHVALASICRSIWH
jgi:hypothetical protein